MLAWFRRLFRRPPRWPLSVIEPHDAMVREEVVDGETQHVLYIRLPKGLHFDEARRATMTRQAGQSYPDMARIEFLERI